MGPGRLGPIRSPAGPPGAGRHESDDLALALPAIEWDELAHTVTVYGRLVLRHRPLGTGSPGASASTGGSRLAPRLLPGLLGRRAGSPMRLPPLVLLIDDDGDTRLAYAGILRQEGVVLTQAGDGQHGFQRAIETVADLIITDISMPIVDGWELMRRLRTDDRTRHIPVMVCSGRDRPPGVQLGVEPNALMGKPCDLDETTARSPTTSWPPGGLSLEVAPRGSPVAAGRARPPALIVAADPAGNAGKRLACGVILR
jgi:CheY-like chemotaxis protein